MENLRIPLEEHQPKRAHDVEQGKKSQGKKKLPKSDLYKKKEGERGWNLFEELKERKKRKLRKKKKKNNRKG